MPEVAVNLGDRSYVITIGRGVLPELGQMVAEHGVTGVVVVSNPTVARFYGEMVMESLRQAGLSAGLALIPAGERYKTLKSTEQVYNAMLDLKIDRRGAVVALGGGVVGDLGGFAAATYMRGVAFYQVPTTLLAQVDASVGGKTGIDLPRGKNLVGAFHQPRAVLIDTATLDTLTGRDLRSGLAEVVKHGIIYDQEFLRFLDSGASGLLARKPALMEHAVRRSVEIKRDVVQQDERESGIRAILNYGHTVGHAVEVVGGYGRYRHGEASSIGMVTEALLAEREGFAQPGLAQAVAAVLARMRLPVQMDPSLDTGEMMRAIELDKKTIGGRLRLALPTAPGRCEVFDGISRQALAGAIEAHRGWVR